MKGHAPHWKPSFNQAESNQVSAETQRDAALTFPRPLKASACCSGKTWQPISTGSLCIRTRCEGHMTNIHNENCYITQ